MKKLSLLVGTLGGAMAGYLFSNKKLREELTSAKDAEAAARVLAKHVKTDGEKIGREAWEFLQSDEVQKNVKKAQKFAEDQFKTAKKQVQALVKKEAKSVVTAVKKKVKKATRR